jgi:hypothetical protein
LNHRWSPPLRLQVSDCSTVRIMCDVPSTVVFCSESIECFPGMASKFFLKRFVTSPMTPINDSNYYWYNLTFSVPHSLYLYA